MQDEFYISLPADAEDQSVAALIRHALASIDLSGVDEQDISIDHCYLISPYTDEDKPSLYVKYSALDKDSIETRQSVLSTIDDSEDNTGWPETIFSLEHGPRLKINRFEQRLTSRNEQGNGIKLLRETAKTLDKLGDVHIKDLVFHDHIDEDGLTYPYITTYYAS